ncbi:hypothetical protein NM77221_0500 [Neisseria meningitidis 77221]|nr:hypothetical protein NM77221_0500 [Neisseria meningitidis 77221]
MAFLRFWYNSFHTVFYRFISDFLRVIPFVSDKILGFLYDFYQVVCNLTVVHVTPSDFKIERISMRVHT